MISNQESALKFVKKILALDFACEEGDFDKEVVTFHLAKEIEGARRFPLSEKFLAVVTMGKGAVVSCSAERLRWARTNLKSFAPEQLFWAAAIARMQTYVGRDSQSMIGPDLKYICTKDTFRPHSLNEEIEVSLVQGRSIHEFYKNNKFPNALGHYHNPLRPRLLACVAEHNGIIVGLAAASADCDSMWQIGIDTETSYRNQGIGKALVSRLTEALFEADKLPYYSTGTSNIASRRIAISLGFRPAWVELYSRGLGSY